MNHLSYGSATTHVIKMTHHFYYMRKVMSHTCLCAFVLKIPATMLIPQHFHVTSSRLFLLHSTLVHPDTWAQIEVNLACVFVVVLVLPLKLMLIISSH